MNSRVFSCDFEFKLLSIMFDRSYFYGDLDAGTTFSKSGFPVSVCFPKIGFLIGSCLFDSVKMSRSSSSSPKFSSAALVSITLYGFGARFYLSTSDISLFLFLCLSNPSKNYSLSSESDLSGFSSSSSDLLKALGGLTGSSSLSSSFLVW